MAKSRFAYRTIGEVEKLLGVPQHVLRYWESQISHIKPVRRGSKARLYRPEDVQLIAGINELINEKGLTIKAVQEALKSHGVKYVSDIGPVALDNGPMADISTDGDSDADDSPSGPAGQQGSESDDSNKRLARVFSRLEHLRMRIHSEINAPPAEH
ncbi:MAG: MerR family transcriptional regulator [Rhodobacteraceae bacterium]|nr:MerR family transcriptional regulator [Paracoccaceae bacterium]